jgi:hypothetical protein
MAFIGNDVRCGHVRELDQIDRWRRELPSATSTLATKYRITKRQILMKFLIVQICRMRCRMSRVIDNHAFHTAKR